MKKVMGFVAALALPIISASAALAAEQPASSASPAAAAAQDEEEKLDEGLKGFGYLAGLTRGCVVDEQRAALEREAMDLNASIGRLLGVDRSYLFAASFGYGTSVKVDPKDCPEIVKTYEERVARHRAAERVAW